MIVKHQLTVALPLKELRREEEENKGGGFRVCQQKGSQTCAGKSKV